MPFNGSGVYETLTPPDFPAVGGEVILASQYNNQVSDIATALTKCLTRDGQTAVTADLPMTNRKHLQVADATARNQYASAGQVQDGSLNYLTAVSGTNTIAATCPAGLASLVAGQFFILTPAAENTGIATLNINGTGAKTIYRSNKSPLGAGGLSAGTPVLLLFDGDGYLLQDPAQGFTFNAVYDHATLSWLRGDTAQAAFRFAVDATGISLLYAAAGANPITWVTLGRWNNNSIVSGGYSITGSRFIAADVTTAAAVNLAFNVNTAINAPAGATHILVGFDATLSSVNSVGSRFATWFAFTDAYITVFNRQEVMCYEHVAVAANLTLHTMSTTMLIPVAGGAGRVKWSQRHTGALSGTGVAYRVLGYFV